ncbi:hypothetical protein CLV24_103207 [Pontibacter ummariensis]|uniref:Uncharacterized protein n=1 Tax=Pontibacter ummariensis TaxID=1610492 RepID=A0A239CMC3_9BACT|nr:hypothetical protein [Pontibacter ummariensis]PRY14968.1 hypothetical protein CLV24_103207 [Pontibacter ummariensis]SNS20503.1 hypothetical protein SAMN06296052_103106 [Pontibacter ummariensis]
MALINKSDIEKLINVQSNTNALCISFYLPTHRAGKETLNGMDGIAFKNEIRKAKDLLKEHGVSDPEIEEYLKPAENLLNDNNFWRHQGEGLAVFITKGFSTYYTLPISMPTAVYVLNQFYITPLLPVLSQNGRFFILCLYREKIGFFEATIDNIRQIDISSFAPETMSESLKFDVKGNDQDFQHSRTTVNGVNIMGNESGSTKGDFEHGRVREFMNDLDNSLWDNILHDSDEPLVLAGVDHYCALYRKYSKYKNILPENVPFDENVDLINKKHVHEKAIEVVKPLMQKSHADSFTRYQNVAGTGVTSDDIATVAAESVHGRIDTLFVTPSQPVWGSYDAKSASAEVHEEYQRGDDDLINLAAVKTISQGGKVYVSSYDGMSEVSNGRGSVKALFRY